jgi:hypothetical protein
MFQRDLGQEPKGAGRSNGGTGRDGKARPAEEGAGVHGWGYHWNGDVGKPRPAEPGWVKGLGQWQEPLTWNPGWKQSPEMFHGALLEWARISYGSQGPSGHLQKPLSCHTW